MWACMLPRDQGQHTGEQAVPVQSGTVSARGSLRNPSTAAGTAQADRAVLGVPGSLQKEVEVVCGTTCQK